MVVLPLLFSCVSRDYCSGVEGPKQLEFLTLGTEMPTAGETKAVTNGADIFLLINNEFHGFNAVTRKFFDAKSPPTPRYGELASDDEIVYLVGGVSGPIAPPDASSILHAEVSAYDPQKDSWSELPEMPAGRAGHATFVLDDFLFVIGGVVSDPLGTATTSVIFIDLKDTEAGWGNLADMPNAIAHGSGAVVDDIFYLVGGGSDLQFPFAGTGPTFSTPISFDANTDSWSTVNFDMAPVQNNAAVNVCGELYTLGGRDISNFDQQSVSVLDASLGFTAAGSLETATSGAGVAVFDGKVHVFGGRTSSASTTKAVQAGWPARDLGDEDDEDTDSSDGGTEVCNDSIDNDGDGLIDLSDPDCSEEKDCNDGIDNDGDGATDKNDDDCDNSCGDCSVVGLVPPTGVVLFAMMLMRRRRDDE